MKNFIQMENLVKRNLLYLWKSIIKDIFVRDQDRYRIKKVLILKNGITNKIISYLARPVNENINNSHTYNLFLFCAYKRICKTNTQSSSSHPTLPWRSSP